MVKQHLADDGEGGVTKVRPVSQDVHLQLVS